MRKSWSREWNSSKQPRKQRKWRANAPLHVRSKLVSAHLSKELRKQYGRRSAPVRTGDDVTVKRGEFSGKSGKVTKVDLQALRIFVDGVKSKRASGQESNVSVDPSNLMITRMNMDDKERVKSMQHAKTTAKEVRG